MPSYRHRHRHPLRRNEPHRLHHPLLRRRSRQFPRLDHRHRIRPHIRRIQPSLRPRSPPAPPAPPQNSSAPPAAYRSTPSPQTSMTYIRRTGCPCPYPLPPLISTAATASRFASATYSVFPSGLISIAHGCVPGFTGSLGFSSASLRPTFPFTRSSSTTSLAFHSATNPRVPSFDTATATG